MKKKEYEIGMNEMSKDGVLDSDDTQAYINVTAEVEQRTYRGENDGLDIDLIAIDGKEIVSISQEFEDEIKDKIIRGLE